MVLHPKKSSNAYKKQSFLQLNKWLSRVSGTWYIYVRNVQNGRSRQNAARTQNGPRKSTARTKFIELWDFLRSINEKKLHILIYVTKQAP